VQSVLATFSLAADETAPSFASADEATVKDVPHASHVQLLVTVIWGVDARASAYGGCTAK
jgi:hypothetical protein